MHEGGKIEVLPLAPVGDRDDLSMAYTPGVARVCNAIAADPAKVHELTIKRNTVAIVTDGTAVLGLGDIGPAAALPVMEGKALLFKEFAGVDAFPICLDVHGADEIVETVVRLAPVFGGINLEDIAAPQCFEVEERLKELLDIPVFHDDQHGTAVVVLAALENALKIVDKKMIDLNIVIAGVGAAGVAITKMLLEAGVAHVVGTDRQGAIWEGRDDLNPAKQWFAENTNPNRVTGSLAQVLPGADVFIGVSGPGLISADDVRTMGPKPIVFAMANPDPEIRPEQVRGHRRGHRHRPQRLPQPDQQRAVLPGHLPRRARRRRHHHHRGHEAGRGRGHRLGGGRGRAQPRLHHPVGVRQAGGQAGGAGRRPRRPCATAWCGERRRHPVQPTAVTGDDRSIEAVTFDFWNTLVHPDDDATRRARRLAVQAVLGDFGHQVDDDVLDDTFRRTFEAHHASWRVEPPVHRSPRRRAGGVAARARPGRGPTRDRDRGLQPRRRRPGHAPHRPRGRDPGRRCTSRGVRLGIICDVGLTPSTVLRGWLDDHGVLELFDHWSFSDEVGWYKPAPQIFEHALAGLGVVAPATPPTWATCAAPTWAGPRPWA